MRGLTLWQPMAWAIAEDHKPIENRPWPLPAKFVGERFAVHAGKRYDADWAALIANAFQLEPPPATAIARGAVIAVARFTGCLTREELYALKPSDLDRFSLPPERLSALQRWFSGPYGFVIADVIKLEEPISCRGFQGLWGLPAEVEAQVEAQVRRLREAK